MRCPRCGVELRVKQRTPEGKILLVCVNPKCEYGKAKQVVKEL